MKYIVKDKIYTLIVALSIISILILGISCRNSDYISPDKGYYTCSMHPQVIKQEPGDCPICHMKLSKVILKKNKYDNKHKHTGHSHSKNDREFKSMKKHFQFSLTHTLLSNSNIYTTTVKKKIFKRQSTFSGHIDYNEGPDYLVIINTKYAGWIERLYVSKEGQYIKRGQLLLAVYSPKILSAKQEYLTTYKAIKTLYQIRKENNKDFKQDKSLIAARQKLLNLDVSHFQINKIEKTLIVDRRTYYYSPISGVVIKKKVLQGSHIKPGMELFRIADLRVLWIYIHIFEKDLQFIKKGQRVTMKTRAYPDRVFKGRIDLIYPFFQKKTRDVKVRIVFQNYAQLLKPGMFIQVDVHSALNRKFFMIPDNAVVYSGKKNYVFVSLGKGAFELRPVTLFARSKGEAAISNGLKMNELVVVNGQFLLDSEASLKSVLQKNKAMGHAH